MIKIRLAKGGRKNAPKFTIVAADGRKARDGQFLAKLGSYNPRNEKEPLTGVKAEEISTWLKNGAQISDTIKTLFKKHKISL